MKESMVKVIHISNDFAGSTVHKCLYRELDKSDIEQYIYCPVRDSGLIGKNYFDGAKITIEYANIIKPYHRYFYHLKQRTLFNYLEKNCDIEKFNIVHATTLLSDGGIALRIYRKYNIPYVVAVRNTDIAVFLDRLPHTWHDAKQILLNAESIIFINKGIKECLENHKAVKTIIERIKHKFIIQPNGVDDFYINHWHNDVHTGNGIVYIGDFTRRKNVKRLCEAVLKLKENEFFSNVKLTLIGGGKGRNGISDGFEDTEKIVSSHPETFINVGPVYDKPELLRILNNNSIFAMPSIDETFGLVYIEALSQNLALLYTKNQGIDGLFDSRVGIAVNPMSVDDIKEALKFMLENRSQFSNKGVNPLSFCWKEIANNYLNLYNKILTK